MHACSDHVHVHCVHDVCGDSAVTALKKRINKLNSNCTTVSDTADTSSSQNYNTPTLSTNNAYKYNTIMITLPDYCRSGGVQLANA